MMPIYCKLCPPGTYHASRLCHRTRHQTPPRVCTTASRVFFRSTPATGPLASGVAHSSSDGCSELGCKWMHGTYKRHMSRRANGIQIPKPSLPATQTHCSPRICIPGMCRCPQESQSLQMVAVVLIPPTHFALPLAERLPSPPPSPQSCPRLSFSRHPQLQFPHDVPPYPENSRFRRWQPVNSQRHNQDNFARGGAIRGHVGTHLLV